MVKQKCSGCKFYDKIKDNASHGLCMNINLLSLGDNGIQIHDKNLEAGLVLVGKNFGCIHFRKII